MHLLAHLFLLRETQSRSGFTLIEMAIVMVVIGLLLAGVLVGQDMIRAAELRSAISQIDQFNAAVYTFKDKYKGLPGDSRLANFPQFLARTGANAQGDGDGFIENFPPGVNYSSQCYEVTAFWSDLSVEGLIDSAEGYTNFGTSGSCFSSSVDPDTNAVDYFPRSKLSDAFVYFNGGSGIDPQIRELGKAFVIGRFNIATSGQPTATKAPIPASIAKRFDEKIDDGIPLTGRVRGSISIYSHYIYVNEGNSEDCLLPDLSDYNALTDYESQKCSLIIKASF